MRNCIQGKLTHTKKNVCDYFERVKSFVQRRKKKNSYIASAFNSQILILVGASEIQNYSGFGII